MKIGQCFLLWSMNIVFLFELVNRMEMASGRCNCDLCMFDRQLNAFLSAYCRFVLLFMVDSVLWKCTSETVGMECVANLDANAVGENDRIFYLFEIKQIITGNIISVNNKRYSNHVFFIHISSSKVEMKIPFHLKYWLILICHVETSNIQSICCLSFDTTNQSIYK